MTDPVPLAGATVHNIAQIRARLRSGVPRQSFISEMPDKGLFGFAAIVGFAAICGLKLNGYNPDLIAVLSVAVMLVYGTLAYYMPRMRMRLDRLGDNFY